MQLNFEIIKDIGNGHYPDLIHFANTQAQLFDVESGEIHGTASDKIDEGEWDELTFRNKEKVSPDASVTNFEVKIIQGFGIIGGYKTGDSHKLIIYEFAFEMDKYLNEAQIKHTINDPISTFSISFENPDINNPERPGNIIANEESTLLSPGAKVVFKFGAGEEYPDFDMGTFYVDRSSYTTLSKTADVEGRNTIGKVLKDQTLDENHIFELDSIHNILTTILENSNLENFEYIVDDNLQNNSFEYDRNMDLLSAIQEILKATTNWHVAELTDGTVVIGNSDFHAFETNSTYCFEKGKDIFSRNIERDDAGSYRRVCVHDREFNVAVYKEAESYEGWNLQANKTFYIEVAEGTTLTTATNYANELAQRLADVGKLESFTGAFRPHLLVGDEAVIVNPNGNKTLGLITEITHRFGKNGFITNFTVDSGGVLGKGKLGDYISQITKQRTSGKIGYEEIPEEE